jgi:2-polyprenyl-3-methyl-5-hydroxy-6-metoxy-1,4-benzoquinol methylase
MADSRWWKDFDAVLGAAVPADSRILDVGCGDGGLVDRLAELGFDAFGADPAAPPHPRLVQQRVEHAQQLGQFDAVTTVMSLHHTELENVVPALANHLRPGGSFFMYELSWDAYDDRAAAWLATYDQSTTDNSVPGWRREHR